MALPRRRLAWCGISISLPVILGVALRLAGQEDKPLRLD